MLPIHSPTFFIPRSIILLCLLSFASLAWSETEPPWSASSSFEFHWGSASPLVHRSFSTDVAETYGTNWQALRVEPEEARAWDTLPAAFQWNMDASLDNFFVHVELPLRRDLEAYSQDPLRSNVPQAIHELDINVPYCGYAQYQGRFGQFRLGRFAQNFSPSPNGVLVAGAPRHDAFWWRLDLPKAQYDFFISSLNATLLGAPSKPGAQPAVGTESWQQQYWTISNQRNRTYTDPYKTFLFHRLAWKPGPWELAAIEQAIVGGKAPELRDANPFISWHDNYNDGAVRANLALEVRLTLAKAGMFWVQSSFEDISSPVGETLGDQPSSVMGLASGWLWQRRSARGHLWTSRLDAVYTDPAYGSHKVPLLKYTSRRIYRSNNRDQADSGFADTWVVDYPIGYHRGPDALDFWYSLSVQADSVRLGIDMAWLNQGERTLQSDYDEARTVSWGPSGTVERELRTSLSSSYRSRYWSLSAQLGLSQFWNYEHQGGESKQALLFGLMAGFLW